MTRKQTKHLADYHAELAAARQRPRCPRCFIVEPGPRSTFRCVLDACPRTFAPLSPIEIRRLRRAESSGGGIDEVRKTCDKAEALRQYSL